MLIFDLDGTLIDSAGDLHRFVNRVLAGHGHAPLSLPEVRGMIGDGVTQLILRAFAARGVPLADPTPQVKQFLEFYAADPVSLTGSYAGVPETLLQFQQRGITMTVSTNKPESISRDILSQLNLLAFFATVRGGDSCGFRKPDPRMVTELLEQFDATGAQSLLIGDSEVDAATAQAAGIPFVLMTYGYRRGPIEAMARIATLDHFADLISLVER
jgi:phosphoglycolate phosphatase